MFGRAGRERRVMVALLQDFLLAGGLPGGPVGSSTLSDCGSPALGKCLMGDGTPVRGDLCGGASSGLVEEHLLGVCFGELTLKCKDHTTSSIAKH